MEILDEFDYDFVPNFVEGSKSAPKVLIPSMNPHLCSISYLCSMLHWFPAAYDSPQQQYSEQFDKWTLTCLNLNTSLWNWKLQACKALVVLRQVRRSEHDLQVFCELFFITCFDKCNEGTEYLHTYIPYRGTILKQVCTSFAIPRNHIKCQWAQHMYGCSECTNIRQCLCKLCSQRQHMPLWSSARMLDICR